MGVQGLYKDGCPLDGIQQSDETDYYRATECRFRVNQEGCAPQDVPTAAKAGCLKVAAEEDTPAAAQELDFRANSLAEKVARMKKSLEEYSQPVHEDTPETLCRRCKELAGICIDGKTQTITERPPATLELFASDNCPKTKQACGYELSPGGWQTERPENGKPVPEAMRMRFEALMAANPNGQVVRETEAKSRSLQRRVNYPKSEFETLCIYCRFQLVACCFESISDIVARREIV